MDYLHRPFSPSILFLSFILACTHTSSSQNLIKNFPSTDGFVSAIVSSGDTVFIGGTFQQVGPSAGNVVKLDTSAGIVDTSFPVFTGPNLIGEVNAVASDGSGGWYVGGYFTYVAGSSRKYFAHINSDMTVDKNKVVLYRAKIKLSFKYEEG